MPALKGTVYIVGDGFATMVADAVVTFEGRQPAKGVQTNLKGRHVQWPDSVPLAVRLALDVLKGDTGAALLLADLVQEQHTGQASELQAEIQRRVSEAERVAVERERARCHAQARRFFDYLSMDPALASDSPTGRACLQIVNNIRTGQ